MIYETLHLMREGLDGHFFRLEQRVNADGMMGRSAYFILTSRLKRRKAGARWRESRPCIWIGKHHRVYITREMAEALKAFCLTCMRRHRMRFGNGNPSIIASKMPLSWDCIDGVMDSKDGNLYPL